MLEAGWEGIMYGFYYNANTTCSLMLVYSDFFLYKTVWAMGQLLRELPSSLVWVFFFYADTLCSV